MKAKLFFRILVILAFANTTNAQNKWVGNNPYGDFTMKNNWDPEMATDGDNLTWNSSQTLAFASRNNSDQTSLYFNFEPLGTWKAVQQIVYWDSFPVGLNLDGNGNGFDVYQKIENYSYHTQTINIPVAAQGTTLELNPINGNLIFLSNVYSNNKEIRIYGNNNKTITFNTSLSGSGAFAIKQNSNVVFNNANTYTGNTYLESGSVTFGIANAISASSNIQFKNTTLNTAGFSANLGNLSFQSGNTNSTINLGNTSHTLIFSDSSSQDWTNGTITINNWGNGSNGKIHFGSSATLTSTQLSKITFTGYLSGATQKINGEIVPANRTCTWQNTNSWTNISGPNAETDAIIDHTYSTNANGIFVAKKLTVNAGKNLTINSNNSITVVNEIINNGDGTNIVFDSGSSLLQTNSVANTGNITYKRTTSVLNNNLDFVYWGSPVANQSLSGMWMTTTNDTFYSFDSTTRNWNYAPSNTIMEVGKGYIARAVSGTGTPTWTPNNSWIANFVGKPNNGDVPFTMVNAGGANIDNLMANPYPSAIDLDFFRNDVDNSDNLTGNFYFWTHNTQYNGTVYTNSDYAILNINLGSGISTSGATPAPDKYVDAGQGFFAEAAIAGIVSFKNTHRVAGNNNAFYKQINNTNVVNSDKIWLNLSNTNGLFKQQLLAYTQNATIDFDPNYDAKSFEGNADIDFYSIIPNKNLAIQSRPTFTANDLVPIGYKSSISGNFSIAIDHSDGLFAAGQTVYLQDNLLGIDFNLLQGAYNFTTNSGTFNNRFVLKYTSALSTTDDNLSANNVIVASDKKTLKIKSVMENIQSVAIYDVIGREIYSQDAINAKEFSKTNVAQNTQTLLIKITLANGVVVSKKIVYKG